MAIDVGERPQAPAAGPRHRRPTPERNKLLGIVVETGTVVVLGLLVAILVRLFVAEAFYVPSGSMESTLLKNDRLIAEKISYLHRDIERGDIIVFRDPGHWLPPESEKQGPLRKSGEFIGVLPRSGQGHLVKRVIGVGGDQVVCCDRSGRITINGHPIDERTYLNNGANPSDQPFNVRVPDGMLWVMGDNRPQSADSRAHLGSPGGGFVPVNNVVGRACCVIWPSERMAKLRRPPTFENSGLNK